jgi:arabinosaccharide transport system substrate-binding protein
VEYPYGKAPLWILLIMLTSGLVVLVTQFKPASERPDLVLVTFAKNHYAAYQKVVPEFEKIHNVKVQLQLVQEQALTNRLQAALLAGSEVPDLVEIMNPNLGTFIRGPLEDVGFVDLTDRIKAEKLDERMVASRFSLWSSRGHIFALPHDVHPIAMAYRSDIIEELGIDVSKIETWDDFIEVGRKITKDFDGDGIPDRYALDLSSDGGDLPILLRQRGSGLFDEEGHVLTDSEITVDTIIWYVHQLYGENRIAFPAGWGQPLSRAMLDGLVIFYFTPDWRSKFFEMDVPQLKGKMALMPMPAWEKGGCRTSSWGGTGLTMTKACKNKELAWELAKFLYLNKEDLGERFALLNIIPPLKEAWDLEEFKTPNPYFSNQAVGTIYAELAPQTPPEYINAYTNVTSSKMREAYLNCVTYYKKNGDEGLREYARKEVKRTANYVRRVIARNKFLYPDAAGPELAFNERSEN